MIRDREEKVKKIFAIVGLFSLIMLTGYQIFSSFFSGEKIARNENEEVIENNEEKNSQESINQTDKETNKTEVQEEKKYEPLKSETNLKVPFTSQAPNGFWDKLHNEACEEAVLIMVDAFLKEKELSKEMAEKEIQALVAWQEKNWGGHYDLTLEQLSDLAKNYYGYTKTRVEKNIKIEDIKKEVAFGHAVILPLAGRLIGNPYYRQPGPYYHMLVVTGYLKDKLVTNDPGTKRGAHYVYDQQVIYDATHDWPGEEKDILEGEKSMLIIER